MTACDRKNTKRFKAFIIKEAKRGKPGQCRSLPAGFYRSPVKEELI
jgi:hypothetical protein